MIALFTHYLGGVMETAPQRDVGFWQFRIHALRITTWWGDYAQRYRNVYPAP